VNVVDSSAWIEFLADDINAARFAPAVEALDELVVPTLCIYEVFKRVVQLKGESAAIDAVGLMLGGRVVELTSSIALEAARLSLEEGLAMADAIILATARLEAATLWTQDSHFEGLDGVEYVAKHA
jgi:predicted nucleic acid-binding protein